MVVYNINLDLMEQDYQDQQQHDPNQWHSKICFKCFFLVFFSTLMVILAKSSNRIVPPLEPLLLDQLKQQFPDMQMKTFNEQFAQKPFNVREDFKVNIGPLNMDQIDSKGYLDITRIIPASTLDFANLSSKINFQQLQLKMRQSIAHELLWFNYDERREKRIVNIQKAKGYTFRGAKGLFEQLNFAQNPNIDSVRQREYAYYNQLYEIGKYQQLPICVLAVGYKIFTRDIYKLFFQSLDRQNYTNFHIVWLDDNSPDQTAYRIYKYLGETETRINNRIKIVHNLHYVGSLGNTHFGIRQYCNQYDIVLTLDSDDSLVGSQALKVINAVYHRHDIWYMYTNYIGVHMAAKSWTKGVSTYLNISTDSYRVAPWIWVTSHARTWKKQLFDKIPFEYFLQYHYNQTEGTIIPVLTSSSSDRYLTYPLLEMAGNDRILFLDHYLYLYDKSGNSAPPCYIQHQQYDEQKARAQTPLNRLSNLNQTPTPTKNYQIPPFILNVLNHVTQSYKQCAQQYGL